jgi:ApaG protein
MSEKYQITVTVRTEYLEAQSKPDEGRYVFAYFITIKNTGKIAAQLISRHWVITDSNSKVYEVKGLGVVGEQPYLTPGATFEYQSGTPLPTPVGTMRGTYQMTAEDGTQFDGVVPEFVLSIPRTLH